MSAVVHVSAAVEGRLDEAVVGRLIRHVGGRPGTVYGKKGKAFLRDRIRGYNNAAQHAPWLVLVDLDMDGDCAVPLRTTWLPRVASRMCFRVAVRAVEAWLLADARSLATFVGVARNEVPVDPEGLPNPKQAMVNLARRSRRSAIQQDMVPRQGSGRDVGPAYTSRLVEYAQYRWQPDIAALRADSLRRAVECVRRLTSSCDS